MSLAKKKEEKGRSNSQNKPSTPKYILRSWQAMNWAISSESGLIKVCKIGLDHVDGGLWQVNEEVGWRTSGKQIDYLASRHNEM